MWIIPRGTENLPYSIEVFSAFGQVFETRSQGDGFLPYPLESYGTVTVQTHCLLVAFSGWPASAHTSVQVVDLQMHQPLTPTSQRIKQRTAHLFYLSNVHPLSKPRITFKLLCVHLPLGQEANLMK
jgi:hypothetical protein